jgi:Zn-dependent M28 family amino/carboxypeptidase
MSRTVGARLVRACVGGLLLTTLVSCAVRRGPPPSTDIDEDSVRADIRALASDDFEGRLPGSAGEDKTVAFLTARFRKLGLKPGNGDSFVQEVPVVELRPSADPTASISGRGTTRPLVYKQDMVIWSQRLDAEVTVTHSELVFVGYGIVAPEYGWNDYAGLDVQGKTVVVLVGDPGSAGADPKLFNGRTMTAYGLVSYKVEEAAREGASAILLVDDPKATGYPWDVIVNDGTTPHLELSSADANATPSSATAPSAMPPSAPPSVAIEGWLSNPAAHRLFAQAGVEFTAAVAAAGKPGFKARILPIALDAQVYHSMRRFHSANVIAILPGEKRRHEYIFYTAHWDHLGRASSAGNPVYNGAVDNATGVAGLLALAQSFHRTRPPPDRTIVFLSLTGTESNRVGSRYYTQHPIFPLDINLDTLQVGGPTRDVTVVGFGESELDGYLRDMAALQGRELHADPHPDLGGYYGSDNYSFAQAGVPAMVAFGGTDDAARGPAFGQAELDDYYAHRFHQTSDQYRDSWDLRGLVSDLTLYYRVGLRLAQTRRFPRWSAKSEFRAIRERSRESID